MSISYRDDWDKIQDALILSGNALSLDRTRAEDAAKIKFSIESIELQKSILRTTKGLTGATIVLAFVTVVLVFVTAFPRCG